MPYITLNELYKKKAFLELTKNAFSAFFIFYQIDDIQLLFIQ